MDKFSELFLSWLGLGLFVIGLVLFGVAAIPNPDDMPLAGIAVFTVGVGTIFLLLAGVPWPRRYETSHRYIPGARIVVANPQSWRDRIRFGIRMPKRGYSKIQKRQIWCDTERKII